MANDYHALFLARKFCRQSHGCLSWPSALMCVPTHLALQLNLEELQKREVVTADGRKMLCPYVGTVEAAGRPDHIHVWTNYGTNNAERVWLHKTALAYAISEERGLAIERRRKENASS